MNWTKICQGLLLFSSIILFVIALSFGGNPALWVSSHYDTPPVGDINSIAIYRSVMGLILGCCAFWTYAVVKTNSFRQHCIP